MKKSSHKHRILSAACIAALPLLVVACLEFDNIIQPESALVDSRRSRSRHSCASRPETNGEGRRLRRIGPRRHGTSATMPRSITTTEDANRSRPFGDRERTLTPMPDTETDPKNGMAWAPPSPPSSAWAATTGKRRDGWIVWRSSTIFDIWDKKTVDGDRRSKLPTSMPT